MKVLKFSMIVERKVQYSFPKTTKTWVGDFIDVVFLINVITFYWLDKEIKGKAMYVIVGLRDKEKVLVDLNKY